MEEKMINKIIELSNDNARMLAVITAVTVYIDSTSFADINVIKRLLCMGEKEED